MWCFMAKLPLEEDIAVLVASYFSDLMAIPVSRARATYQYVDGINKKNYPYQTFNARFEFSPKKLEILRVHVRDWAERIRFEMLGQNATKVIWRTPPQVMGNDQRQKYVRYIDIFMRCAFVRSNGDQVKANFGLKLDGYPILYYPGVNPPLLGKNNMREVSIAQKE